MASYVIHHTAGIVFLKTLEKSYHVMLDEAQRNDFLLGNLIVDSSRLQLDIAEDLSPEVKHRLKKEFMIKVQIEKKSTHFRPQEDEKLVIQVPDITKFLEKYKNLVMQNFSALGYLYHLYVDKMFFYNLFCESFECLDQNLKPAKYQNNLAYVRIKKNGKLCLASDIFNHNSDISIYRDYTIMNRKVLEYFRIPFEFNSLNDYANDHFKNPGISEVDYHNIIAVLQKTREYIKKSYQDDLGELKIFNEEKVKNFIPILVSAFINEYNNVLNKILDCHQEEYKRARKK